MNSMFTKNILARNTSSVFFMFLMLFMSIVPMYLVKPKHAQADAIVFDPFQFFYQLEQFALQETDSELQIAWFSWDEAKWAIEEAWQNLMEGFAEQDWYKEFVLDPAGWILSKLVIRSLTIMTVNWIQSGFNGNAFFPTDKTMLFASIADDDIRSLIYDLQNIQNLPDYLKQTMLMQIQQEFYYNFIPSLRPGGSSYPDMGFRTDAQYRAYQNDYRNCYYADPWECFLLTSEIQNNPISASARVYNQAKWRIQQRISHVVHDLVEGSGFLTVGVCTQHLTNSGTGETKCLREEKMTPGDAIGYTTKRYLTANLDSQIVADELSESVTDIINALINQFMQQGLRYMSGG